MARELTYGELWERAIERQAREELWEARRRIERKIFWDKVNHYGGQVVMCALWLGMCGYTFWAATWPH